MCFPQAIQKMAKCLNAPGVAMPAVLTPAAEGPSSGQTVTFSELGDARRNTLSLSDRNYGCRYYGGRNGPDPW